VSCGSSHGIFHGLRRGAIRTGDSLARVAEETCRRAPDVLLFRRFWRRSYTARIIGHCQNGGYSAGPGSARRAATGGLVALYHSATWSLGPVMFSPVSLSWECLTGLGGRRHSRKGALATVLTNNRNLTSVVVVNTHLQGAVWKAHVCGGATWSGCRARSIRRSAHWQRSSHAVGWRFQHDTFRCAVCSVAGALDRLTADFRQVCETEDAQVVDVLRWKDFSEVD